MPTKQTAKTTKPKTVTAWNDGMRKAIVAHFPDTVDSDFVDNSQQAFIDVYSQRTGVPRADVSKMVTQALKS
jgi:hypothetical protein